MHLTNRFLLSCECLVFPELCIIRNHMIYFNTFVHYFTCSYIYYRCLCLNIIRINVLMYIINYQFFISYFEHYVLENHLPVHFVSNQRSWSHIRYVLYISVPQTPSVLVIFTIFCCLIFNAVGFHYFLKSRVYSL